MCGKLVIQSEQEVAAMVERKGYLQQLLSWKDEQVIKVVTGIRRCGKSTLLQQYQKLLRGQGVSDSQIIAINFEDLEYESLLDYAALYRFIKERLQPDRMTYIFLDEIQKVPSFEKAVDSLYVQPNTDIYITGSNAYLLSGDLATYLTGRYVEISMLPLSFREFVEATGLPVEQAFTEYGKSGSLPYVAVMDRTDEKVDAYLEGIYNTVIVKDIEDRQSRKETDPKKRKVTDIVLLKTIARYLASVIGSPVSIKSVADYLISSGRKVSTNTVSDYMEALIESYVFYPAERFDIVGKQLLKSNMVYFELLRRGYQVAIGKNGTAEVDFVARKQGILTYYQVTADLTAEETFEREMRPLRSIRDNYEKIILTLDRFTLGNYDGIKVVHVLDWLMGQA